ncbi:response regulator transcription factor [Nonomuraea sp. NPDC046570]|uniref:response regulator transcription factor n=1 Tax=Nonomuraea sp. NPDC046570 TaxID=3155255 RepID=UPI003410E6B4
MSKGDVLVVDDEPQVRDAVARALRVEGYQVASVADGVTALAVAAVDRPDLIVLDVMMPDMDGLQVCRRLRAEGDRTPVLMLTALDGVGDRVSGLDAGADDYVIKPFALEELFARVRALLRRTSASGGALEYGGLALNVETRQARRAGRVFDLTRTEAALLELLLRNAGNVLTRELILERIWGYDFTPGSNSLEVYIRYLRRKTEQGGEARLIQTVHGLGYVVREGH